MNDRPKLLDLFCGAGGAALGYRRAGFHVTGVDTAPQPRYAGHRFIQADALTFDMSDFDAIHASPPCQAYSPTRFSTGKIYPDYILRVREALEDQGVPYIIENVPGAPIGGGVILCGIMFDLRVYRHRRFAGNIPLAAPLHPKHTVVVGSHRGRGRKAAYQAGGMVTITGNAGSYCGDAMGIDWMIGRELSQAIPPAYAEFIGRQLMAHVTSRRSAKNESRE